MNIIYWNALGLLLIMRLQTDVKREVNAMLKKALGLVITAVMLLGVFGLTACNNDTLDTYKTAGKATIETYANERKDSFCTDNWMVVCGLVTAGKAAVDIADSKTGVDTAVATTKAEIDKVGLKGEIPFNEGYLGGQFVSLDGDELLQAVIYSQLELAAFFDKHELAWENNSPIWERYSNEFFEENVILLYFAVTPSISVSYVLDTVTMTDKLTLHIVGQYYGDIFLDAEGFASFVIEVCKSDISEAKSFEVDIKGKNLLSQGGNAMEKHSKSDNGIEVVLENRIRQSFLELQENSDLTIDSIFVGKYYGTYNQASAVIVMIQGDGVGDAEWSETVAGITFSQSSWTPIRVWRDGTFYTLTQAFENEFYLIENLTTIFNLTFA